MNHVSVSIQYILRKYPARALGQVKNGAVIGVQSCKIKY